MFCVNSRNMYAKCHDESGLAKINFCIIKTETSRTSECGRAHSAPRRIRRLCSDFERTYSVRTYRKVLHDLMVAALGSRGPEFEFMSAFSRISCSL